ncbi:MAG: hypothetical protein C4297_07345 [Gemmataceae bacterium]
MSYQDGSFPSSWVAWRRVKRALGRLARGLGIVRSPDAYRHWRTRRIHERRALYATPAQGPYLSVLTPVYCPDAAHFWSLGRSLLAQDYPHWEWVLVVNGKQPAAIRWLIGRWTAERRVRVVQLAQNHGIVGGLRRALAEAQGEYIVPVDHDDLLVGDALRVLAHGIAEAERPAVVYSDEDKWHRHRPCYPFFKPAWDPVLFLNCCYVAHATAVRRDLAREVEAYSDASAEGCPDWDLYCRLLEAGQTPVHLPEILYSWRIHAGSTSTYEAGAKPYTVESQYAVLSRHVRRRFRGHAQVVANPLYGHAGMWCLSFAQRAVRSCAVCVLCAGDAPALRDTLDMLARTSGAHLDVYLAGALPVGTPELIEAYTGVGALGNVREVQARGLSEVFRLVLQKSGTSGSVAVLLAGFVPAQPGWLQEGAGLMEAFPQAVGVCGRVLDAQGHVRSAGQVLGFGGLAGSPLADGHWPPSGYHGLLYSQHAVSTPGPEWFLVRGSFLQQALARLASVRTERALTWWLGALALEQERFFVYSPFLVVRQVAPAPTWQSDWEEEEFLRHYGYLLGKDPYYGAHLDLAPGNGYLLALPGSRERMLSRFGARIFPQPIASAPGTLEEEHDSRPPQARPPPPGVFRRAEPARCGRAGMRVK